MVKRIWELFGTNGEKLILKYEKFGLQNIHKLVIM